MQIVPGNTTEARRVVVEDHSETWEAWDKLPKTIREVLMDCPFEYSPVQVLEAYNEVVQDCAYDFLGALDRRGPIRIMIDMINQNIAVDLAEYREKLHSAPRRSTYS